eukprot:scaffold18222_cov75-Isochrysis_galbana.AAC.1
MPLGGVGGSGGREWARASSSGRSRPWRAGTRGGGGEGRDCVSAPTLTGTDARRRGWHGRPRGGRTAFPTPHLWKRSMSILFSRTIPPTTISFRSTISPTCCCMSRVKPDTYRWRIASSSACWAGSSPRSAALPAATAAPPVPAGAIWDTTSSAMRSTPGAKSEDRRDGSMRRKTAETSSSLLVTKSVMRVAISDALAGTIPCRP